MNNFYQRPPIEQLTLKGNDFIGFINNVLNLYPELKIKENSLLYKAAVNQYNTQIINLPNAERIPVPSWFCGYVDTQNGFLYVSKPELAQGAATLIKNADVDVNTLSITPSSYPADKCLTYGQPGNLDYSYCEVLPIDQVNPNAIAWSESFYPDIQPTLNILEQDAFNSATIITRAVGTLVHEQLTFDECYDLVRIYGGTCSINPSNPTKYSFNKSGPNDNQEDCLARLYFKDLAQLGYAYFHEYEKDCQRYGLAKCAGFPGQLVELTTGAYVNPSHPNRTTLRLTTYKIKSDTTNYPSFTSGGQTYRATLWINNCLYGYLKDAQLGGSSVETHDVDISKIYNIGTSTYQRISLYENIYISIGSYSTSKKVWEVMTCQYATY